MTLGKSIYASKLNWTNIFLQILMLFLFSFLFKSLVLKASQKKKIHFLSVSLNLISIIYIKEGISTSENSILVAFFIKEI